MTDLLIRNVDAETVGRIQENADRQGLSREEYLRRELSRLPRVPKRPITRADLERALSDFADLADESVMSRAWS